MRGHALMQNLRRDHYELGCDARPHRRVAAVFAELALDNLSEKPDGTRSRADPSSSTQQCRTAKCHPAMFTADPWLTSLGVV